MAKKATATRVKKSPRAGQSATGSSSARASGTKGSPTPKAGSPKVAKSKVVKASGSKASGAAKSEKAPPTKRSPKSKRAAKEPVSKERASKERASKEHASEDAGSKRTAKKSSARVKPGERSKPAQKPKATTGKAPAEPAKKAKASGEGPAAKKTRSTSSAKKEASAKDKDSPVASRDTEVAVGGDANVGGAKTTKKVVAGKSASEPAPPEVEARKGITVVAKKQSRRSRPAVSGTYMLPSGGFKTLGATFGKPLIPSGPGAVVPSSLAFSGDGAKKKSPFTKRELAKFRRILEEKRDELSGAVSDLDVQTQRTGSSETSKSQALDDQGSEAADQALSLDLVAAERRLLSEIIAAIKRIDDGTYGICELTGKPIRVERLEELPWTRYSIDAARELERRQLRT